MVFWIPTYVEGRTVPHCKALRHGKDESRGLRSDITLISAVTVVEFHSEAGGIQYVFHPNEPPQRIF